MPKGVKQGNGLRSHVPKGVKQGNGLRSHVPKGDKQGNGLRSHVPERNKIIIMSLFSFLCSDLQNFIYIYCLSDFDIRLLNSHLTSSNLSFLILCRYIMFGRGICENYQSRDEQFSEPNGEGNLVSILVFFASTPPKHDISV